MTKVHNVKTWEPSFSALARKDKTFEVRRNDRNFQLGDVLKHQQYHVCPACEGNGIERGDGAKRACKSCNGKPLTKGDAPPLYTVVTYILPGGKFGIGKDFVVMSVKRVWPHALTTYGEGKEITSRAVLYLPVSNPKPGSKHCPALKENQTLELLEAATPVQLPLFASDAPKD